ncbi:MAG: response regulator transcription factor [Chloroherpetonaceae bacterium]|nr:response regulator transcription factor [Chthonomonadaceae bacterium]MDW8209232.1 response regulator transcription factor [Chloroherpetonaceae bacterium]
MVTTGKLRIVLVEDRILFRQGLAALIHAETDLEVAGEACDVDEARRICSRTRPEIIVISERLLWQEHTPSARAILEACCPGTVLVTLRDHSPATDTVPGSMELPTLYADRDRLAFIRALRALASGTRYRHLPASLSPTITRREREILHMLVQGLSNKEIAQRLALRTQTVKNHVSRLLNKLCLVDRTQLAVYALEHHLDAPPPDLQPSASSTGHTSTR